jgi:acetyl-CoA synthetase
MSNSITQLLRENRSFYPSQSFQSKANLNNEDVYKEMWEQAKNNPDAFWSEQAQSLLVWQTRWSQVLEQIESNTFRWFVGGRLNASVNCLDRHLDTRGDKTAILWEGEPGDRRSYTYRELHEEVCRFANVLKKQNVQTGDIVTLYMPLLPELVIAILACARLGATHNVVFAGFSAHSLRDRIVDCSSKLVITADGGHRKGATLDLKVIVDEALLTAPLVQNVIVLMRAGVPVQMKEGRDHWWHQLTADVDTHHEAEAFPSEHPLFILYTSGSTGKPKGIMHGTGGYMVGATLSTKYAFDLKEEDRLWCTADAGWITGHTYGIYGPLSNGTTVFMYEGAPNQPHWGRFWHLIEKYKLTILYTAPTAIRAFMKEGRNWPDQYDLSSLRLLGSVGEPINPEAWIWYHSVIGKERCPIIDTWWQTETGGIMMTPLPGMSKTKPGSAAIPFFGVVPDIVDEEGKSVPAFQGGYLILRQSWPSMMLGIYGDKDRHKELYWSKFPNVYFTGDGARKDDDGYYWIMGRVDDVLNVSGHRLSTMELESSLVSHPSVAEAAVVAKKDEIRGECIVCFVTLKKGQTKSDNLIKELKAHVVHEIGSIARPEEIHIVDLLPKTRSGKIMRRLLRTMAAGQDVQGDLSTLEDRSALIMDANLQEELHILR